MLTTRKKQRNANNNLQQEFCALMFERNRCGVKNKISLPAEKQARKMRGRERGESFFKFECEGRRIN